MKYVVTHTSPDMDAITSVWLILRFLPGWNEAKIEYVPAGERKTPPSDEIIQEIGDNEYITVDTGLGPLDHHQTSDTNICGASLTWDFVQKQNEQAFENKEEKKAAINRIIKVVVAIDHFQELFWGDPVADYQEFQLVNVLEGLKYLFPDQDDKYTDFVIQSLDALVHEFENRIWAEKEISQDGIEFKTKWGKGIGFETLNDTVIKLSQKMGYVIVLRKDPNKGYVRIKARPQDQSENGPNVDLTLLYEQLKKIDPEATWFLHASRKMLLNGSPKNPKMVSTKLSLQELIKIIEKL